MTKNLNWQILTKNLITFKTLDGLKMKNVDIMGFTNLKGKGVTKKQLYMGNCLKRGTWAIFRGLGKKREEGFFEAGLITSMHTMT